MSADGDFDRFFERTWPVMLARAVMMSGDRQLAEDAAQDAFAEALRYWDRVGTYESPEAWVHKVMAQRVWAASRRRRKQRQLGLAVALPPQSTVERTAEARATLGALAGLPAAQRAAMVLHCLEGLTQEETAKRLGVNRGTVAASIHAARRTLARLLGVTETHGSGDQPLVAAARSGGPGARPAAPADPLAARLRRAERWLREGWEADEDAGRRLRAAVGRRAAEPLVRRRRRLRRWLRPGAAAGEER
jgi:RNA polymerase sigma-70 factor (ECF subfamily)